jgi:nitrogen fixation/metabolism regulation signal transduction histidine kinase
LKSENVDESTTIEIEKDIERLQTITDRFSKIGSEPILEKKDCRRDLAILYLSSIPLFKNILNSFEGPKSPIFVMLNPTLHSWTIENLVKNAIDAMKGRGKLALKNKQDHDSIK